MTIEQTLTDYINIISHVKSLFLSAEDVPIIVIGTGLGGSYALWLKQQYPDIVSYAISTGAPLEARVEFPEYIEQIVYAYGVLATVRCNAIINSAFFDLIELFYENDSEQISELFKLATPLDTSNQFDVAFFIQELIDFVIDPVPYGNSDEINEFCLIFKNDTEPSNALTRFAEGYVELRGTGQNFNYTDHVDYLQNPAISVHANTNERQSLFLACSQASWFQTTTNLQEPFNTGVPAAYFIGLCEDVFGEDFTVDSIYDGNEALNALFNGENIILSNVLVISSRLNPNYLVGELLNLNPTTKTILLDNYGTGQEFKPQNENDSEELANVKTNILDLLSTWLE